MLSVHNKIWGTLNTIESSTNVHIKIFCSFHVWGMLKNRNYENDNDKLQCFTKTFNSQKYKKKFSRKTRQVAIRSCFYTLDFYKV